MIAAFLLAFPALFSIVNPIAGSFIFREATADRTHAERVVLARRVGLYSLLVMLVALWTGSYILAFFGISIGALRIAGGAMLIGFAWELIGAPEKRQDRKQQQAADKGADDVAFFPLTLPFTTGPGTIAVSVALGAGHPDAGAGLPGGQPGLFGFFIGVSLAALAVACLIALLYAVADRLGAWLGRSATQTISRLSAFILLCIGRPGLPRRCRRRAGSASRASLTGTLLGNSTLRADAERLGRERPSPAGPHGRRYGLRFRHPDTDHHRPRQRATRCQHRPRHARCVRVEPPVSARPAARTDRAHRTRRRCARADRVGPAQPDPLLVAGRRAADAFRLPDDPSRFRVLRPRHLSLHACDPAGDAADPAPGGRHRLRNWLGRHHGGARLPQCRRVRRRHQPGRPDAHPRQRHPGRRRGLGPGTAICSAATSTANST